MSADPAPDRADHHDPYTGFPPGFFARDDERPDADFYGPPRLVTHIDDAATAAVGDLYAELGIDGSARAPRRVLDLMSSWVSHFRTPPAELVVLGMNADELAANPAATERVVHDLNADPRLPLPDDDVDAAVCCVSIDYLTRPIEVLAEVGRVLRPGGTLAVTFSDRCFPTKAVRGWLLTDDAQHGTIVAELVRRTGRFTEPVVELRTEPGVGDPLYAVVATAR
ncbi:SAM-dependent methyltransferase [Geodermatophilus bullaregiensis]|uniref:class I SAM-dependent methyltransferase n=1 Tax=Geodermatophilus bullaregiensis TaxID=1564160 RepID=UPI0019580F97|nr:methyltransferase domain-containing protein [Geodermatophilus bullaregiensis]MBM7804678.1 SAM-dependent methyltransferase [Geodermatophilus bullaregiensis]